MNIIQFLKINNKSFENNTKGFSLIEIMIVLLIGAMIMSAGFIGYRYYKQAKVNATKQKLSSIDNAIETYNINIGEYPQQLEELINGPQKPALKRKWSGALVGEKDLIDSWGNQFHYNLNPKGSKIPYDLYAVNPDGTNIYSAISQGEGA